ncbi:MAG: hypothetical protein OWU84_05750 [Firmicutes bacterium]|nr:hypothetical protein [Bacillota bacterium]
MDTLGICVETEDATLADAVHMLVSRLHAWQLATSQTTCQLTVRLSLGPPGITYGSAELKPLVANLAHVTDLPAHRSWISSDPGMIELRFSRGFVPSSTLLGQIAWVLFLWAASNHIDHETFMPLYAGATLTPRSATPAPTVSTGAASQAATATNPLAKFHRPHAPGMAPVAPPTPKAKPSGG